MTLQSLAIIDVSRLKPGIWKTLCLGICRLEPSVYSGIGNSNAQLYAGGSMVGFGMELVWAAALELARSAQPNAHFEDGSRAAHFRRSRIRTYACWAARASAPYHRVGRRPQPHASGRHRGPDPEPA